MLSSTSKELLKVSLNKYWGPNPNKEGNLCIVGHNYNDERFFGKLHKIEKMFQYELEDRIELVVDNPYVSNIKRYEGELKEVDKFNISFQ